MVKENRRKDILRLGKIFEFPGEDVWDEMRHGRLAIVGKNYLFIKVDGITNTISGYGGISFDAITILNIITGNKKKFSYWFYAVCDEDPNRKLGLSFNHASKMYKFNTGEEISNEVMLSRLSKHL